MKRRQQKQTGLVDVILCNAMGLVITAAAGVMTPEGLVAAQPDRPAEPLPGRYRLYVGTYTSGESKGIYLLDFDAGSGALMPVGLAGEAVNPSFLAVHPGGRFLYSVGEIGEFAGRKSGAVNAFAIDAASGKLRLLNQQPSGGSGPCHVCLDAKGSNALVANYSSGSAAVLPINPDGSLAPPSSVVQHEGSGPNPARQKGPHAHSINLDPAGRFAFVADLGVDRVFIYRFDSARGTLEANAPAAAKVPPGGGPRHFAFHPGGRFAYTNNELTSSVTAFAYAPERGELRDFQTLTTLPDDFASPNTTAEILVHPSGRFLYCSNRGHDSIAIFSIDPDSGRLTARGHQSTGGETPRNFGIDPAGRWLIAANQKSGTLCVFRIDGDSGMLERVGDPVSIPSPVCVRFVALGE